MKITNPFYDLLNCILKKWERQGWIDVDHAAWEPWARDSEVCAGDTDAKVVLLMEQALENT